MKIKYLFVIFLLVIIVQQPANAAFGPTVPQNGIWQTVSSFQMVMAKIDGKIVKVCLPRLIFRDKVDQHIIKKQLKKGIKQQKAIFHLYHNGLGIPKRKFGMLFASDVYLKDIKMTYTGYLRKIGYKFEVSKTKPFEDRDYLRDVMYSKVLTAKYEKKKKEKAKIKKTPKVKQPVSHMKVTTIWDVLPKGVIPPSIRREQREIERRIRIVKLHTYLSRNVEVNPIRWAIGKMGILKNDGTISGAFVEGHKPMMKLPPPKEAEWLTPELINQLNGQPCEFVFQRDLNGLEVIENGKYILRDLYLKDLKITWEEWLQKNQLTYNELPFRDGYATQTVTLKVRRVSGKWNKLIAPAICSVKIYSKKKKDYMTIAFRIKPPKNRPSNFKEFAREFNKKMEGQELTVFMLVCENGKMYKELGQLRAKEILFKKGNKALSKLMEN